MHVKPDCIYVRESFSEDIVAEKADLRVVIRGMSMFTGDAALRKAGEVRQLVREMTAIGVAENDIGLADVRAHVESGLLRKTSGVTYVLKIRCSELERMADLMGIITAQRNAVLEEIAWIYPDLQPKHDECLARCLQASREKAVMIAQALGVSIDGVHEMTEESNNDESRLLCAIFGNFEERLSRTDRLNAETLGVSISHRKRVTVTVRVEYKVARQSSSAA
jgi:hypothetical protein